MPGASSLPTGPLEEEAFAEVLNGCERHRLVGFLGAAVRAGDFQVSDSQRQKLEGLLQGWFAHGLRLERLLLSAHDCLRTAHIEHRVLKGIALAHTVYDDPSSRIFGDVDLVVESSAFPRAARILEEEIGARRTNPERRPGFDARFGSAAELRYGHLELDVHRTLVYGALGLTVDIGELVGNPRSFILAGRELQTLAGPQQLIHACYAAVLSDWPPRLASLRDIVQVHEALRPDLDTTIRLAGDWTAAGVLARGVAHAWVELGLSGGTPLVDWARSYRPTSLERLLMAAYRGPGRGYTRQVVSPLVIPGLRAKLAFIHGMVFPQREFLDRRQLRWTTFARHAVGRIRDWPSRAWFDR